MISAPRFFVSILALSAGLVAVCWSSAQAFAALRDLARRDDDGRSSVRLMITLAFLAFAAVRLLWGNGLLRP